MIYQKIRLLNYIIGNWEKYKIWSYKLVKNISKACKIYIDNIEDNRSFRIEFESELFSFGIISFKLIFKNSLPRHSLGIQQNQFHWVRNIELLPNFKFRINRSQCVSVRYINALKIKSEFNIITGFKGLSPPYDRSRIRNLFHCVRNRGITL